jgi:chondroitin-sulfate-ABC endolyase/exolyase
LDPQLAGIYLGCSQADDALTRQFKKANVPPLQLNGHINLNGTAAALHRRKQWLVAIDGTNQWRRGIEIYGWTQSNCYSRWVCNGSVFVLSQGDPITPAANGYQQAGWDWNRWPGATSLVVPAPQLFKHYGAFGNQGPLAGGTSLSGHGAWSIDYSDNDLSFKKSAFCFDNHVTVITTDITSPSPFPAVTTLYQAALHKNDPPTFIDGSAQDDLDHQQTLEGDQLHWLLDHYRNGYYLHPGDDKIVVARQRQQWVAMYERHLRDPQDNPITINGTKIAFRGEKPGEKSGVNINALEKYYLPTEGNFATSWFHHGVRPQGGSAAYTLVVDVSKNEMETFVDQMEAGQDAPLQLLQQNSAAHIVYARKHNAYGYALFEEQGLQAVDSPLLAVDRPCVALLKTTKQNLILSVYSSDQANTSDYRLRLRGRWNFSGNAEIAGFKVLTKKDTTTVRLPYTLDVPAKIRLSQAQ